MKQSGTHTTSQNAPFNFILPFFFLPDEKFLEPFLFPGPSPVLQVQALPLTSWSSCPLITLSSSRDPSCSPADGLLTRKPSSSSSHRWCWAGSPTISRWFHSPAQIVSLCSPPLHRFRWTAQALVTLETRFHIGCFLLSLIFGCHHSTWYFSTANKSISSTLFLKSRTGSQGLQLPMLLYLLLGQWHLQKPKEQQQVKDYPDAWQYKNLDRQQKEDPLNIDGLKQSADAHDRNKSMITTSRW